MANGEFYIQRLTLKIYNQETMNFRPNKPKKNRLLYMASMTDIIFLLLIFFMLTSNNLTPAGKAVEIPKGSGSKFLTKNTITITKGLEYYLNGEQVSLQEMEGLLRQKLDGAEEKAVVIAADKDITAKHLFEVMRICKNCEASVSISTRPD
jgi:biopolymer transport protein ExbD